jgi:3-mercaptopyruvate sulfurtransferase SseA
MMFKQKAYILYVVTVLMFVMPACNASSPTAEPTIALTQTLAATQMMEPVSTQTQVNVPESEAEVPRVSVEETKAALDSGSALIVDVRSAEAYAAGHVPGAINIQLGEFETNPTGLALDKDKWIITYCT